MRSVTRGWYPGRFIELGRLSRPGLLDFESYDWLVFILLVGCLFVDIRSPPVVVIFRRIVWLTPSRVSCLSVDNWFRFGLATIGWFDRMVVFTFNFLS